MGGMKKEKSSSTSTSPCAHLRSDYQRCFNRWYSEKYLKGEWEKEECISEWDKYRACLAQHLKDDHLIRLLQPESHSGISVNDSQ